LAVLEPYSSFGEMSFFHSAEHSASVRARTAVRLLCLSRRRFDSLLDRQACAAFKLACNTVVGLSQRLRDMNQWVAELEGRKPAGKLGAEWSELRRKVFDGWQL
jgi:CRP-like cAMP-binding protein